jgi:hypothetical protein
MKNRSTQETANTMQGGVNLYRRKRNVVDNGDDDNDDDDDDEGDDDDDDRGQLLPSS